MKQNKWQMKAWAEKAHEGYADVNYVDVWSLDEILADLISKHLHAFLKAEKGPNGGCPHIIVNQVGEERAHGTWLQIIRKMIYAFDESLDSKTGERRVVVEPVLCALSPDVIVFHGKQGIDNCRVPELKEKYKVVVMDHPSSCRNGGDTLQYIVNVMQKQLDV